MSTRNFIVALMLVGGLGSAFPVSAAPLRVAVLPVVVHSSDDDSEYLSAGLSEMLSARLEQAGGIDVVALESDARATTKARVAAETARSVGAGFVIFGSFTQFGDGASLDLRAARVDSEDSDGGPDSHRVFIQSGTLGAIIPRLDDVAGRIVHFIRGKGVAAAPAASGEPPQGAASLDDLERRVKALESSVFPQQPTGSAAAASDAE